MLLGRWNLLNQAKKVLTWQPGQELENKTSANPTHWIYSWWSAWDNREAKQMQGQEHLKQEPWELEASKETSYGNFKSTRVRWCVPEVHSPGSRCVGWPLWPGAPLPGFLSPLTSTAWLKPRTSKVVVDIFSTTRCFKALRAVEKIQLSKWQ